MRTITLPGISPVFVEHVTNVSDLVFSVWINCHCALKSFVLHMLPDAVREVLPCMNLFDDEKSRPFRVISPNEV